MINTHSLHTTSPFYAYPQLLAQAFSETLWPTRCVICDKPAELLCPDCERKLHYIDSWQCCPFCGAENGRIQCSECGTGSASDLLFCETPFDGCRSVTRFDEISGKLVKVWKDGGERRLGGFLAASIAQNIPLEWLKHYPAITYIPATRNALSKRGFDHGRELAQSCAYYSSLPLIDCFYPPKTLDQRALGRKERKENMESRFELKRTALPYNAIIIIDDVMTSGSTLLSASSLLKRQKVDFVWAHTFARVPERGK